jgi:dipeptidyl aminopeptidase/acylaminoacyl peptidase
MTRLVRPHASRTLWTRTLLVCLTAVWLLSLSVVAQQAPKRPLTHTDYDHWRAIQLQQLSRDGKFLAYALNPQDADGEVVARALASTTDWRYPRGHRPDAAPAVTTDDETGNCDPIDDGGQPIPDDLVANCLQDQGRGGGRGGAGAAAATGASGLAFTTDSRFLAFQVFPTKAETEAARKANTRPADMPQNAMGVMDLTTGKVERIERVRRFQVPEQGGAFVAYLLEPKAEASAAPSSDSANRPEGAAATPPAGGGQTAAAAGTGRQGGRGGAGRQGGSGTAARRTPARTEYGVDLVVRNLTDKTEKTIADVLDFSFSKDGKFLTYTVSSHKPETNGVYRQAVGSADAPVSILTGKGKYTRLTWDEKQTQLVFLTDRDDAAARQPKQKIFYWNGQGTAVELVNSDQAATASKGMVIAERAGLTFSQDGTKVFFGVAPPSDQPDASAEEGAQAAPAAPATPDEETINADLWHWKDDFVQPMQKVRADQERNRTYRAVFHIAEKKLVQLADPTMQDVTTTTDGRWGLGADDRSYRIMVGYDSTFSDYYLVNTLDGSRKPLVKKQAGGVTWSPNGKFALYFDGKNWNSISVPDGRTVNLTRDLGVNFWQETNDTPGGGGAYGNGGWTKDDKYVLLNDRYDVWQVAADGSGAKNLTDGVGRKDKTVFRVLRVDQSERGIDAAQPLLLSAESEWTHDTGFYRDKIDGALPQKLIMASKRFSAPTKAKDAEVYLLTASTFNEFPDLQVSGPNFTDMKKVSNANPQKAQINWGTAELVRFKNSDGVPLTATLFKPENFDPSKKYPMMVYIYEILSNNVNNFVNPAPGTSINIAYYVSNGYLVLTPDIVYNIGHPGQSALKCVLPAIQSIVDKGIVDEKAIGIQGHSWGGYQIAYMITQTDRFRAVEAGAPVSNMTSAYSGIRWGTGLPRQFQYEKTQSRIGVPLYDDPLLYFENSAVFHAATVHTPVLLLHNDGDDAVPWYQGIEYYLALRRLNKEAYMYTYNGEPHGLRRRADMKDYTVRMQEFFDHFLKNAPAPQWMVKGIPYLEREKEKDRIKTIYAAKPTATTDKK